MHDEDEYYRGKITGSQRVALKTKIENLKVPCNILEDIPVDDFDFNGIEAETNDHTMLPPSTVLRKMKSEMMQEKRQARTNMADATAFARVNPTYVLELSIIPFRMVCSLLKEKPSISELPGFSESPVYVDATGSIVLKQDDYTKRVYYYVGVVAVRGQTLAIVEFLTDCHSATNIAE